MTRGDLKLSDVPYNITSGARMPAIGLGTSVRLIFRRIECLGGQHFNPDKRVVYLEDRA